MSVAGNNDERNQRPLVRFEPGFKIIAGQILQSRFGSDCRPRVGVFAKQRPHEEIHRVGIVVFTKFLDTGKLQELLGCDVIFREYWLLQNIHQYFQSLVYFAADAIEYVAEEIRLVDDPNAGARILEPA